MTTRKRVKKFGGKKTIGGIPKLGKNHEIERKPAPYVSHARLDKRYCVGGPRAHGKKNLDRREA